jgi:hypothetical protein
MHAQFSSQNPLACTITDSDLTSKALNGSMSILTNELLKIGNSVGRCAAEGHTCVLGVLKGCPTGPEPSMSFKHPYTAHAFFTEWLSNHCKGLRPTVSEICTKFYTHSLFLFRNHREIAPDQIHDSE